MSLKPDITSSSSPILIVENADTTLPRLSDAMRVAGLENRLILLSDMEAAIDYLDGTGAYANRQKYPLPGLLLVDVTLPQLSAFELSPWLTPPPVSRQIIVADMGGVDDQRAFKSGLAFGPNAVICKLSSSDSLGTMFTELQRHCVDSEKLSSERLTLHAA